jgi:hemoglobin
MPTADLCTEDEIAGLVHSFYAKARDDARLGPIFEAHVEDWDHHLGKMVDFWSSALRGSKRYRGTPMPKHVALPGLSPALFHRWLELFRETTAEIGNEPMRVRANELAERIAESLWFGYQMYREPSRIAEPISQG